ncbi:putative resolvase, N domain protein [Burkholderia pseudomallei MSHR7343]|nr:putative resolvase, N domain protein [Burkholderia pseudomallei MSHR7343]
MSENKLSIFSDMGYDSDIDFVLLESTTCPEPSHTLVSAQPTRRHPTNSAKLRRPAFRSTSAESLRKVFPEA